MRYWKAKRFILAWQRMNSRRLNFDPTDTLVRHKKRKYLLFWYQITSLLKKYKLYTKQSKDVILGTTFVNNTKRKVIARNMLHRWREEVMLFHRICQARRWHRNTSLRNHFRQWQNYVDSSRLSQYQHDHKRFIREELERIRLSSDHQKDETIIRSRTGSDSSSLENQSSVQGDSHHRRDAESRRKEYNSSVHDIIASMQVKDRKARYEQEKKEFRSAWELEWENKEKQIEDEVVKKTNHWLRSREGKDQTLKRIKLIQRQLQSPDEIISSSIRHGGSIALSLLDSRLGHKGLISDDFFDELIMRSDGRGAIDSSTFLSVLEHHNLSLRTIDIRDIFEHYGDDNVENNTSFIDVHNLKVAMAESRAYGSSGIEGCQWKKYVDPVNQYVIFHNVIQGKKVMEYSLNRKLLREIAIDQLFYDEITRERRNISVEKKLDWESKIKLNAARKLQVFWISRKNVEKTHRRAWLRLNKQRKATPRK